MQTGVYTTILTIRWYSVSSIAMITGKKKEAPLDYLLLSFSSKNLHLLEEILLLTTFSLENHRVMLAETNSIAIMNMLLDFFRLCYLFFF